jgi:hypothetical protein
MCDGHVKLKSRAKHHFVRCEKCGLKFAIGADPIIAKLADAAPAWLTIVAVSLIALLIGIALGRNLP